MLPRSLASRLSLAALALVALHIADDSFFQPQPGTSAGDHLLSGLLPLALLALVAAALPRFGGTARGLTTVALGLFGLVAGVEAGYYATHGGASGDDYTGFLSLAAGAVLVGVGVVTLWRTRARSGTIVRRTGRRAALALGGAAALFVVALPVGFGYITTHVGRPAPDVDLGRPAQEVSFRTTDGLRLAGLYVPSRNGAAVIVAPGREGPQAHARMLVRHGYGVLLFDQRGEGRSQGDPNVFAWDGEPDYRAAVGYLTRRPDVAAGRIGALGLSVAGEMLLQTAAHDTRLRAVVSEGAGSRSAAEEHGRHEGGVSGALSLSLVAAMEVTTMAFSNSTAPANLDDLVGHIAPRPLLLIWAGRGMGGEDRNPALYRHARGPKELWGLPEAHHTGGLEVRPRAYERRVVGFFDRALRPGR